jgi:hypothetical protein
MAKEKRSIKNVLRTVFTFDRVLGYVQIIALVVLIITVSLMMRQTNIMQSDYEARTRPYLAIEQITLEEEGNDYYLVISVTNFGERPATDVKLGQLSVQTMSVTPWNDVAYLITGDTEKRMMIPQRAYRMAMCITKTDYEEVISTANKLIIRLEYSSGSVNYQYQAEATMQADGEWSIDDYEKES